MENKKLVSKILDAANLISKASRAGSGSFLVTGAKGYTYWKDFLDVDINLIRCNKIERYLRK